MAFIIYFLTGFLSFIIVREFIKFYVLKDKSAYRKSFKLNHKEKIRIVLSSKYNFIKQDRLKHHLLAKIADYRDQTTNKSGFVIPPVKIEFSKDIEKNNYELYFLNKLASTGYFYSNKLLISEAALILLADSPPKKFATFIHFDKSKYYEIDKKTLKSYFKSENIKPEELCIKDYFDLIMEEVEFNCYKNIDDVIDITYVYEYSRAESFGIGYKDKYGDYRILSTERTSLYNGITYKK